MAPYSTRRDAIECASCSVLRGAYLRPGFPRSALVRCARSTPRSPLALARPPSPNCQKLNVIVGIRWFVLTFRARARFVCVSLVCPASRERSGGAPGGVRSVACGGGEALRHRTGLWKSSLRRGVSRAWGHEEIQAKKSRQRMGEAFRWSARALL
jgi:hypothetical protein